MAKTVATLTEELIIANIDGDRLSLDERLSRSGMDRLEDDHMGWGLS